MKAKRVNLYYGIFLSVYTFVLGALFISCAVGILSDGGWVQGAYSREIVAERLFPLSIPFYLWIISIIVGFIISVIFRYEERSSNKPREGVTLNRLKKRIPQGTGEEYENKLHSVYRQEQSRLVFYAVCAAICLAGAIASAVYIFNRANFPAHDLNDEMFNMMVNVLPWMAVAFACCVAASVFAKYSQRREITAIKQMMADYKGVPAIKTENKIADKTAKIKSVVFSKYVLLGVRIGVAVFGVTFVILGIFNDGWRDVLIKAINVCTECIGLG